MNQQIQDLIAGVAARAGPLVITVFGDAIAPRGGAVWMAGLIGLMAPFGMSERRVRTGVYRLAREGWLEATTHGRQSSYAITAEGLLSFAAADARIYSAHAPVWPGRWIIVQGLGAMSGNSGAALKKFLIWSGFGQLSSSAFIRPDTGDFKLPTAFEGRAAVFSGDLCRADDTRAIAAAAWNLEEFGQAYRQFLDQFASFAKSPPVTPLDAFMVRTLLIHQYRRILLKDPQLPAELLDANWPGTRARDMTAQLYRRVSPAADAFLAENLSCPEGPCPQPRAAYHSRFAT